MILPRRYRPSNGTEGEAFWSRWCDRCRRGQDENHPCPIQADTFFLDVRDFHYPLAWVYDRNGKPGCTVFVPAGWEPTYRCPSTPDLFPETLT